MMDVLCPLVLVLSVLFTSSNGDVFKTGDAFPGAKQMHPASSSMMIVMENYAFKQDGVVTEFTMYVHNTNNITLQVWRRVGGLNSTDHALVGEYLYKPAYENVEQTAKLYWGSYIFVKKGDVLGFTMDATGTIGYRVDKDETLLYKEAANLAKRVSINDVVSFKRLNLPYQFSLEATLDNNIDYFRNVPDPIPTTTTTPKTTYGGVPVTKTMGTQKFVGAYMVATTHYMQAGAKKAFIINDYKTENGFMIKFEAYFAKTNIGTIKCQIWRPTPSKREFALVGESEEFEPKVVGRAEIPLATNKRFRVQTGDRLGFSNQRESSPVGQVLRPQHRQNLLHSGRGTYSYNSTLGHLGVFDTLLSPFEFLLGMVYDTDIGKYTSMPTAAPSPTTKPTAITNPTATPKPTQATKSTPTTIVTVPTTTSVNPLTLTSVGHLFDERDQLKELFSKKNQVFLLSDVTLSQGLGDAGGYVTSFEAVFVKANPMSFLVWREKGKNNFVLVGRKDYTPNADDLYKKKMVTFATSDMQIKVKKGDKLGILSRSDGYCSVGYKFQNAQAFKTDLPSSYELKVDNNVTFNGLGMPYFFSVQVTYAKSTSDPDPVTTTMKTKSTSPKPTPTTTKSNNGGGNNNFGNQSNKWTDQINLTNNPTLVWALIIWLIVVTILFTILCICVLARRNKTKELEKRLIESSFSSLNRKSLGQSSNMDLTDNKASSLYAANWSYEADTNTTTPKEAAATGTATMESDSTMRSDDVIDYFNPTVGVVSRGDVSLRRANQGSSWVQGKM